jgi:hypothetical protein
VPIHVCSERAWTKAASRWWHRNHLHFSACLDARRVVTERPVVAGERPLKLLRCVDMRPVAESASWLGWMRLCQLSCRPVCSAIASTRSVTSAAMRLSVLCRLSRNICWSDVGSAVSTALASTPCETLPFRATDCSDLKYAASSSSAAGDVLRSSDSSEPMNLRPASSEKPLPSIAMNNTGFFVCTAS